jgi:hypothetical protein
MLTYSQLKQRDEQLSKLLDQLKTGEIECIAYGIPNGSSYMDHLRIRYIATAGGVQYQLRTINPMGVEGSGYYTTNKEELIVHAMNSLIHYHRPLPTLISRDERKAMMDSENSFCFYPIVEQDACLTKMHLV